MARIRSVHPDICVSETMAALSAELERTFVRLWTHCDDEGRCVDNPRLIKAALFPLQDEMTAGVVHEHLEALERVGLIRRYSADGKRVLAVRSWSEFQKPQKPRRSVLPEPTAPVAIRDDYGTAPVVLPDEYASGVGEGGGGEDGGGDIALPPAARRSTRTVDPLWDALIEVLGVVGEPTKTERGRYNAALKELRDAGATPNEIRRRAQVYREVMPAGSTFTAHALAANWALCANPPPAPESAAVRAIREQRRLEGRE